MGAASQMATKLEKKGLILRSSDPEDRRRTIVRLTEKGILLYQRHMEYDKKSLELMNDIFCEFSDEDMERLIYAERLFRKALHAKVND